MRRTLLFLLISVSVFAQRHTITHEDVWLMPRVGEPILSPDGKQVVVSVVEPDYDPAKQSSDLWLLPSDGSAPARRLTASKASESDVAWSPEGKKIAFVAKRESDEVAQIYILPLDGGEAVRLTTLSTGASSPKWRPDGKAMLFESMVYPGGADDAAQKKIAAERKARKWNARIYETFPVRYWNAWLDEKVPHVFVQETEGSAAPKDLLANAKMATLPGYGGSFNPTGGGQSLGAIWSPDGKDVVFSAIVNRDQTMYAGVETHLYRVSAAGGEPVRLTLVTGASFSRARFAPQTGTLFATTSKEGTEKQLYHLQRLAKIPYPTPGTPEVLTSGWDRAVSGFAFSPDGKTVYVEAEDDGFDKFFSLPAAGGDVKLMFDVKKGSYSDLKAGPGVFIARYQASNQPPEVVSVNVQRGMHSFLTTFTQERVSKIEWSEPVHFWFTAKNGKKLHSMIVPPANADPSKKYPLVAFPHGGPNSMSKDGFSTRWNNQLLVSPGYYLLETNYTGSTGFGEKFADDIERDVLRGPAQECLDAIEEAAKRFPGIDTKRQAAIGASYGGYLMNWFNGHTNQFRAMVNHAGATNNESQYGVNDGGLDRELRMGSPIWEALKKGQWEDQSPFRYSNKWETPMLITQGELDFRVPLSESMTTFKILQRRKVPSRIVFFPEEGHWILRGENSKKHMEEVLGWLRLYLDPTEPVWQPVPVPNPESAR